MYPWPFKYFRAQSIEHAVATLAEHGPDAAVLAGGCSLIPLMKYRLAQPEVLVDISFLEEDLQFVRRAQDEIRIGALVRHSDAITDPIAADQPLVARVAKAVSDAQVRNMGTVVGGVCSVAPISDWITTVMAMRGTIVAHGPSGQRDVDADTFVVGMYENSLGDDELATEVRLPTKVPHSGASLQKLLVRANDAMINAAAALSVDDAGRISAAGLALGSVTPAPYRPVAAEEFLVGQHPEPQVLAEMSETALAGVEPFSDTHGDAEYRRSAAGVLLQRAVREAYDEAVSEVQS